MSLAVVVRLTRLGFVPAPDLCGSICGSQPDPPDLEVAMGPIHKIAGCAAVA